LTRGVKEKGVKQGIRLLRGVINVGLDVVVKGKIPTLPGMELRFFNEALYSDLPKHPGSLGR
jgi:hypothetical protein